MIAAPTEKIFGRDEFPDRPEFATAASISDLTLNVHVFPSGCWICALPPSIGERMTLEPHPFEVLPKRWIVERTFAWLSRFRRLARDFERYARTVAAFIRLAMIRIMLKRLVANPSS